MENKQIRPPRIRYIAMIAVAVLAVGVVFYHAVEHLNWVDSVYFCVITLTTIGYGDIVPTTNAGKVFTSVYVIVGIGIFAAAANYLIKRAAIDRIQRRQDKQDLKKQQG